ncbi:MAG: type II toxin-antitoxin system HicA family toxin [Candidatus Latescibacteria bacterium]|nr:type II toxin-antitoxin system HicA family toxin [Candidatus Latescibacterota bacterium]
MPRLSPVSWKVLECIFQKAGYIFERQVGSHRTYFRDGIIRPIVIPAHSKDIAVGIIRSLMNTANMNRDEYFKYLSKCK